MPFFDTYVMVDWSATKPSEPEETVKPRKDAIWWAVRRAMSSTAWSGRRDTQSVLGRMESGVFFEAGRDDAMRHLARFLQNEIMADRRVLVGFDFAFGYPADFAKVLTKEASAKSVWEWMHRHVLCKDTGRVVEADRFEIAAQINKLIKARYRVDFGPFYGAERPPHLLGVDAYAYADKPPKAERRNRPYGKEWEFKFGQKRLTDRVAKGAHPVWKLSTQGAVGSQVLLGISWLHHLCENIRTMAGNESCVVWPLSTSTLSADRKHRVVVVEIFPSILGSLVEQYRMGEIRDAAQVRLCALAYSLLDTDGDLKDLFDLGTLIGRLSQDESRDAGLRKHIRNGREAIENEEGWILGVGHESELHRVLHEHFSADEE